MRPIIPSAAPLFPLLLALALALVPWGARAQDVEVSTPTPEDWVQLLKDFPILSPGHIQAAEMDQMRRILNAPLEEIPPEVRTGLALRQLKIFDSQGDWPAVERLQQRITSPGWPRNDLDAVPLARIANYRISTVFSYPGGWSGVEPADSFSNRSGGYWRANIRSHEKANEICDWIVSHCSLNFIITAGSGHYLAHELFLHGEPERSRELRESLFKAAEEGYFGLAYYDEFGRYLSSEEMLRQKSGALENVLAEYERRYAAASRPTPDLSLLKPMVGPSDPFSSPDRPTTATPPLATSTPPPATPVATAVAEPEMLGAPPPASVEPAPSRQAPSRFPLGVVFAVVVGVIVLLNIGLRLVRRMGN